MPGLPELETLRRDLESTVVGRRIIGVRGHDRRVIKHPSVEDFVVRLTGSRIESIDRRAKYLIMRLDRGQYWVVHLGLEGQFLYQTADAPLEAMTVLAVRLDDGRELRLRDLAGIAKTVLAQHGEIIPGLSLDDLGPEPLDPEFDFERFRERLASRRAMIKPLLLDQKVISGISNVYADEALFLARIHPTRKANTLSESELRALYEGLREGLAAGLAHRGSSAPGSAYRDIWGRQGHHQDYLKVYRREGEACPEGCSGTVRKIQVGGRSSFICPNCQR